MNNKIRIKNYVFELIRDESGCIIVVQSDYCEEGLLNFINKNLPKGIEKIPDIEKFIMEMISEYKKND